MANRRIVKRTKGATGSDSGVFFGAGVLLFSGAGAPTNGTTGTGAGFAAPGSIYVRASTTNSKAYINTNTKASPTWTVVGAQTA